MKILLAILGNICYNVYTVKERKNNFVKIFLASVCTNKDAYYPTNEKPHYVLDSFFYLKATTEKKKQSIDVYMNWLKQSKMFLLDSGAFSFIEKCRKGKSFTDSDMGKYLDDYIDFINKYDIKYFFELDVDCLYDYEKVKQIRKYLEYKTNKKCIPVWHKSRGMEEWIKMTKEYDYVAIGGIASKEINRIKDFDLFVEMCDIAHKNNCKVHGLGYLSLKVLNNDICPFDTVDGTAWQGHRRGDKFYIDEDGNINREKVPMGKDWKSRAQECYVTWTQYSKKKDV